MSYKVAMTHTRIAFLDIDDVLNTFEEMESIREANPTVGSRDLAPRCLLQPYMGHLQRLSDTTGVGFVIASSWRRHFDLPTLRDIFRGVGFTGAIVDSLPPYGPRGSDDRDLLAAEWLAVHPEVTEWVVIDDTPDGWDRNPLFKDRLVWTRWVAGLNEGHVTRAQGLLSPHV